MAKMLMLNTSLLTWQEVENENIVTLVQQDVNLGDIQDGGQAGKPAGGSMMGMWMILLIVFAVFVLFRPRQDKEGDKFRNALQKEQDVVTSSGIFGKIKDIDEVSVTIEIAQGMKIKVDKRYVNPVPTPQPAKPERSKRRRKAEPNKDEKAKY